MNVDYRLQDYFTKAKLFNRTKEKVWGDMLRVMALTDDGPGGRAAQRFAS